MFSSIKNKGLIGGVLAASAYCVTLEWDTRVVAFRSRPFLIQLTDTSYLVDLAVLRIGAVLECVAVFNSPADLGRDTRALIWRIAGELSRHDIGFRLVYGSTLERSPHVATLQRLYRNINRPLGAGTAERLVGLLRQLPNPFRLNEAYALCGANNIPHAAIDKLVWDGILTFDRATRLTDYTLLRIAQ